MTGSTGWTTPADIRSQIEKAWQRGQILAAPLTGASLFPMTLTLRRPDGRALSERFDDARAWIRTLEDGSRARQGYGYDIAWSEINHRLLGRNRVPTAVRLASETDALRLIGRQRQAAQFHSLAEGTLARFPMLCGWLARKPLVALENVGNWERVLAVLTWFAAHPRAGMYLRQIDIPGVDTKFIEAQKGLLAELLDLVLPQDAIDQRFAGSRGFEQRYGLVSKPLLVRFRVLDQDLRICGFSDLTVPTAEFARLHLPLERVFITENDINGLTFPSVPKSLIIFGLGYGLDRLGEINWMKNVELHYWGDIDTHGFAILDRLRAVCPQAQSLLMDRETLTIHRTLWGQEDSRYIAPLGRLTPAEQALFDDLRCNRLGEGVRLEQERIHFSWVRQTVGAFIQP
ncbi:hypothetical protein FHP25_07175 [Vineibacter terrae]|uniref:DUF3322 and DUF2220 domain-containing protein n=1 Tax=Vineibacter terrae TaxID=2586908 RepID=A0A5C8PRC1_9HYPH|nr:DUF3322 domain-containing protein [Vineibacter terrae]TXL78768.1 hypothetical protein FHP25_07175 [Vineibacter terrae]